MRIWHKDLIPVLPRQQLLGQWREICLIAKSIAENGTPNHVLVNKVMDYPLSHLWEYARLIHEEKKRRGYRGDFERFEQWIQQPLVDTIPEKAELFEGWHNGRYLRQCLYNLEEKADCGAIPDEEWIAIVKWNRNRFSGR